MWQWKSKYIHWLVNLTKSLSICTPANFGSRNSNMTLVCEIGKIFINYSYTHNSISLGCQTRSEMFEKLAKFGSGNSNTFLSPPLHNSTEKNTIDRVYLLILVPLFGDLIFPVLFQIFMYRTQNYVMILGEIKTVFFYLFYTFWSPDWKSVTYGFELVSLLVSHAKLQKCPTRLFL